MIKTNRLFKGRSCYILKFSRKTEQNFPCILRNKSSAVLFHKKWGNSKCHVSLHSSRFDYLIVPMTLFCTRNNGEGYLTDKLFLKSGVLWVLSDSIAIHGCNFLVFRRLSLANYDDRYGASKLLKHDGERIAQLFSKLLNDVDVTVCLSFLFFRDVLVFY